MRERVGLLVGGDAQQHSWRAVLRVGPWRNRYDASCCPAQARDEMDPSVLAAMDKDALKKQIENMKYQATMERWPLSKSIAAWVL